MLMAHSGDVVIFAAGPHSNKPACNTAGDDWAISIVTASGMAMYALLLSAQKQGKPVTIVGSGACSAWADREAPLYIYVAQ
jgi:hypothetical protein